MFASTFDKLAEDKPDSASRCVFDLLDFEGKGKLTIVLLLQILKNFDRQTHFAQEIYMLVKEFKNKNVLLKGGYRRKISLNYSFFSEMIPHSCLIDELQYVLFGTYIPFKNSLDAE